MAHQKSIKEPARVDGVNVYNNRKNHVIFHPAEEDSGLVFIVNGKNVPALLKHAQHRKRGISLDNGKAAVYIAEHVLSPVYALGIDNLVIELSDGVCPTTDNSSQEVFLALKGARSEQTAEKRFLVYDERKVIVVKSGKERPDSLTLRPSKRFIIDYFASYPHKAIGEQKYTFDFDEHAYERDIMRARSPAIFPDKLFQYLSDKHFFKLFLGLRHFGFHGINERNYLLVGSKEAEHYANPPEFGVRYDGQEFVRHKVLDALGTLALFGRQFSNAKFIFHMTGHGFDLDALKHLDRKAYFKHNDSRLRMYD